MHRIFSSLIVAGVAVVSVSSPSVASAATWHGHSYAKVTKLSLTQPVGYSPAQIRHAYGFDQLAAAGSGKLVAIVAAYDSPDIGKSLATFDTTFGLSQLNGIPGKPACTVSAGPHPCLEVRYADGKKPKTTIGWKTESALDTEWAHAIAPQADILLTEAKDDSLESLLVAVDTASAQHPTTLSMSWGGDEFSGELSAASHFSSKAVHYVAASGDNGNGTNFPAAVPSVLSVGGTSLTVGATGERSTEAAWPGSGGGTSKYFSLPSYQQNLGIRSKREIPDVSYAADPAHGYAVYLAGTGWMEVGGTSAGAPQWAAALTLGNFTSIDTLYAKPNSFFDITSGKNGKCRELCIAKAGYDSVTGLGSPTAKLFR